MNLDQLIVFYGELNPETAYLYVKQKLSGHRGQLRLGGSVSGPTSLLTRTLSARIPLTDMGPGSGLLARALVPDPCFWGPAQPYLYDVDVQLYRNDQLVASTSRTIGFRMFGARGRQLLLEAKPWALLGLDDTGNRSASWTQWGKQDVARIMTDPTDEDCREASRQGVMLVADVTPQDSVELNSEVRRLSRHAAVTILIVRSRQFDSKDLREHAPNLVLADYCSGNEPIQPASWADVVVCEVDQLESLPGRLIGCSVPVIVYKRSTPVDSLSAARDRCAALQKELSQIGDFAGCIV